jgi:predicted phage tail protein
MSNLTIKLLGSLARRFGQSHTIQATKLNEGISYLRYQFAEFEQSILELDRQGIRFSLVYQTATSNLLIDDPTGLNLAITQDTTLIIAPVPAAAGDVGKFILGVGLISLSAFLPGSISVFGASITSSTIGLYGAGLVLGSVINWLSPKPVETKSSVISPTISNNAQGNPIPFGYGRRFVTPQVISGGTQIVDLSTTQHRGNGSFFGGWGEDYLAARSIAKLQIVDALGEGLIKGLSFGERSIWLNGVPMKNLDNSLAFQGITALTYQYGSQTDTALPAPWDKVLGEVNVSQKLTQSIGQVTRRINNNRSTNLNGIRVRLYWDRCLRTNDGDNAGANTGHRISIKEGDGSWQVRWQQTEYIYSSSSFEREIYLSVNQASYYEIKVERVTSDDDSLGHTISTAYWKSYTTVVNAKLKYPNTAKIAFNIDLEKFGSTSVERVYQLDLLQILIPNNATVRADGSLSYSGIWTGNFQRAWSSDPAWALYDMLTNDRYGCGVSPTKLDKYAFYACSAYCAALVPDGYGGTEPRFNLNALITTRDTAYNLIQKLCGVFNAIAYYEAGNLVPVVDRPLSVTHQFTNANATFNYAGTAYRNRRNRAIVSYTRPEVPNSTDYEIYEDKADILKRGVEELQIDATQTCTSRGQAQRMGHWAIYSEQRQKESISIQTGLDGALVRPGDIIQVGDRDRAGLRRWGRIKAATINTVTLDSALTLPSGTYTMSCTLPDATLVERTISTIAGNIVTISPNFTTIPDPQSSWLIAGADLQPTLYRVISRAEPETHRFEILALLHEPSKYAAIEQGVNLIEPPRAVTIPSPPLPPQALVLTANYGINISIGVAWTAPTPSIYTTGYQIEYRRIGDAPVTANTTAPAYLITMAGYGEYEIKVRSIDTTGAYSGWIVNTISIDVTAYFATCYLAEIADTWMASTLSPIEIVAAQTIFGSTTIIDPTPQTIFGSSTQVFILNP